jgi:glutathione synthase
MLEAAARGHEVWTCELGELGLEHDDAIAKARPTKVVEADTPAGAFTTGDTSAIPLEAFGAVLMRKDPPVDADYVQATWLLELARDKTLLVNDPRGLRELNEHLSVLQFPDLTPPTIVTRDAGRVRAFLDEQGGAVVVKPIDGYGGLGVFVVRSGDPNTSALLENATRAGRAWTIAQRYRPEAREGDKRVMMIDGEPLGAVLRVPPANEARGNLHVGARAVKTALDDDDRAIMRAVTPRMRALGLHFVGFDVIGGRLTELNFTSPTGIRHIDALNGGNSAAPVLDWIERHAIR